MTETHPATRLDQRGFVLVTSLIFLVVITLIAVSAINSSTLQERMASNLRNKSHARQNADSGLRYAENLVRDQSGPRFLQINYCMDSKKGKNEGASEFRDGLRIWAENAVFGCSVKDISSAFLSPEFWSDDSKIQIYSPEPNDPTAKFIVEILEFQCRDLNPDTCALGEGNAFYRITARAHGATPAAIAVTQSIYEQQN
ncbi:pilus assembly PilX family protein [Salinisphaera sp.]|uniref:pilus assembly PilX family protein n=1 Tax=Salinisphaera sp. TaxID=1914330 RepID=UPI002D766189|nr:PilX N-terminal domain-containing pilus assembly protein [Salinisphaera sp.]HET7314739.1 PilX N-terminal domain-containing pilus assembly protein [Salinisphaera sp.]